MENLANWANWDWTLGPQWTKQAKQFQTFPPPQQPLAPNCSTDNQCCAATPGPSCGVCTVCQRNSPPVTWKTRLAFVCLPKEYGNFDSPYSCGLKYGKICQQLWLESILTILTKTGIWCDCMWLQLIYQIENLQYASSQCVVNALSTCAEYIILNSQPVQGSSHCLTKACFGTAFLMAK